MEGLYQRKIEKISQAIYLITNHIKDSEPLKWELRRQSIGFVSCTRSLAEEGEAESVPPDLILEALSTYARDIISLTTLAVVGGIISRTNGEILMNEIKALITSFTDSLSLSALRPGYVLSHEFFAADPDFQEKLGFGNSKGQTGNLSDTRKNAAASGLPTANRSVASVGQKSIEKQGDIVKDKKNIRQSQIIELLRQRSHLTIRDFSIVISDCSEKTIQRELIDLVEKGLVKREGERRWSTYSLR